MRSCIFACQSLTHLRVTNSASDKTAVIVKTVMENPRLPASTLNSFPWKFSLKSKGFRFPRTLSNWQMIFQQTFDAWYMLAISQGKPRPRKTLTELLPVTFPMALSAYFSFIAAARLAKRSGRDVPRATKVMAEFNDIRYRNNHLIIELY